MRFTVRAAGVAVALVCSAILALALLAPAAPYAEANTIARDAANFSELSDRFEKLAEDKGGVYAYQVLLRTPLPYGTDVHLLAHVVGDELYKEKGSAGIADCTQDFRNACSHSIVIGTLQDFGEAGLEKVREACKQAPGGSGAYTMCFHGLGHGVFAAQGYDLARTAAFCKKTGTEEYHQQEYMECFGGAIMELMGGGGHDKALWERQRATYITSDPLSPCSSSVVPEDLKGICYLYISPQLFVDAGAPLDEPQPQHFKVAFTYCDRISASEPEWRSACFAGIGKEFPVLAMGRDVRALGDASDAELKLMWQWCALAPHQEGRRACMQSVADSLFWGGENDPRLTVRYCTIVPDGYKSDCFGHMRSIIPSYLKDEQKDAACALIPEAYRGTCASDEPSV